MLDQEQFIDFTAKVVAELMPDEQLAFEISGPDIAQTLYQEGIVGGNRQAGSEFAFIEAVEHTLTFVTLMAGTFQAVHKLYTSLRGKNVDVSVVATRWKDELKNAGLGPEMAEQVVKKFEGELSALVAARAGK